ncbi:MAG: hypothetical protein JST68_00145 [Bacteroidetes bacterium]|nr:hypothetical protein [Bacteroidota bacterium]
MSFYYWRTTFSLDSQEIHTLRDNTVDTLYVRYFDVDWPAADTAPTPLAPIRFESSPAGYTIIPVVYIRNKVFEKLTPAALPGFTNNVHTLIQRISQSQAIVSREVQFDCDWTERTKDTYFQFLRTYRTLSKQALSCTIRLHQVKYSGRTGIPPVDHGILMYYNMGAIDTSSLSSIYDKSISHRYTPSLRSYPLTLDLALPVFTWGLKVRDGKVVQLLDKMNTGLFDKDSSFRRQSPNRYTAAQGCFKSGYYFQAGDQVKIESVSAGDLKEIVTDVNQHTNHHIRNLIFFDLDSQNLQSYDKDLFKEILAHTD